MCGIFVVVNDKQDRAAQTVLAGLKKLEYRGYDSWGIALKTKAEHTLRIEKHVGKIGSAQTVLPSGPVAIGHTRWATHGGVTDVNAHPHRDCTGTVAVLHNGIVENYQELKSALVSKGHVFVSETDTEVIAHLVEEELKTMKIKDAVLSAFAQLIGSNAIAVLEEKTGTVIACRNGSPLVAGIKAGEYFLASDVTALLDKTDTVHFLDDNEAVIMDRNGIKMCDAATGKRIDPRFEKVNWTAQDAQKGGYPHFLLKEIMEQKLTIPKAMKVNGEAVSKIAGLIRDGRDTVFVGCGTAYYCGLASTYLFAKEGLKSRAYGAYELNPFLGEITEKTLLVAISQSGETADTILAVKEAKKKGATIVAAVNARASTLERMSDIVLSVQAGPEIAVVSTKAYSSQLATMLMLAKTASGNEVTKSQFQKDLSSWLNEKLCNRILAVAKSIMLENHAFVIGKHFNYPASFEFALKMKETSYMHAEAFASGELKHGVLTLVQKNTPCFVLTGNDEVFKEVRSSAMEMRSRGGFIIGVGPQNAPEFDAFIKTPDTGEEYALFYNVIVGQLLGYFLGVGRGADPDKPRNLAKSVTVK